jgi:hypothetical protein
MPAKKPTKKCPDNNNVTTTQADVNPDLNIFKDLVVLSELPLESVPTAIVTVRDKITTLIDTSAFPDVAVDAEWQGDEFLSKQFTFCDNKLGAKTTIVIWNNKYELPTEFPDLGHPLLVYNVDITTSIFDIVKLRAAVRMLLFFAFKDLTAIFGKDVVLKALEAGVIDKKRNISGVLNFVHTKVKIRDCYGMFNSSLENGLISVGIDVSKSKAVSYTHLTLPTTYC